MPYRSFGERRARRRAKVAASGLVTGLDPFQELEAKAWQLGQRVQALDEELRSFATPSGRLKGRAFGIGPFMWRSATRRIALATLAELKNARAELAATEAKIEAVGRTVRAEAMRQLSGEADLDGTELNRAPAPGPLVATMRQSASLAALEPNRLPHELRASPGLASEILRLKPNQRLVPPEKRPKR